MKIEEIARIIGGNLLDAEDKSNLEINDFETIYSFVKNRSTAYFSPSKDSWSKELGRSKTAPEGNDLIEKDNEHIGLIITEKYVTDLKYKIPQLIVTDSVKALKTLAIHIRSNYYNPLVAITGSMGKSSTRMLISTLLKDFNVLENRGNNNIRAAVYTNMLKLIKNPDFAVIETSLNAINNRENTALNLKPDIAIITGIGAAHFSTFKSLKEIALLKSRIFEGLSENGIAIINANTMFANDLKTIAHKHTNHVKSYSISKNIAADFHLNSINYHKGFMEFDLQSGHYGDQFKINTISEGMISNALAAIATVQSLNVPLKKTYLEDFKPFSKVLAMKHIATKSHEVTIIDDTHNASLPAMINAIKAFNSQTRFFTGNKIIALGKINDLGHKSKAVHSELIDVLSKSNADYILCLDSDLRLVVNKVMNKHITWYPNKELLLNDLKYLCNQDSLTLLKSSSGGTDFPLVAKQLPSILRNFALNLSTNDLFIENSKIGKSYLIVDNKTNKIIECSNTDHSMTIEGMGPLLYYLKFIDDRLINQKIIMHDWITNNNDFYAGKETDLFSLIEAMTESPHPSQTYELVDYLFENFAQRKQYINNCIKNLSLSNAIAVNLTGRFRIKERQCFTVHDLYNVFCSYKYDLFKFNNAFILGLKYKSGMIRGSKHTIIFTSYQNVEALKDKITF